MYIGGDVHTKFLDEILCLQLRWLEWIDIRSDLFECELDASHRVRQLGTRVSVVLVDVVQHFSLLLVHHFPPLCSTELVFSLFQDLLDAFCHIICSICSSVIIVISSSSNGGSSINLMQVDDDDDDETLKQRNSEFECSVCKTKGKKKGKRKETLPLS